MNKIKNQPIRQLLALAIATFLLHTAATAQTTYTGNSVDLVVSGTSTLHDWDMKSAKANCTAVFTLNAANQLTALTALNFSTPVNSLKSDHTAMDNNAYKALKTDKNPAITYTMNTASVTPADAGTGASAGAATVKVTGHLTIAGAGRDEEIVATVKPNADNSITVTGSKKISMKDFNMQPPTFMLGTIKTGNDIVLKFTMILKRS